MYSRVKSPDSEPATDVTKVYLLNTIIGVAGLAAWQFDDSVSGAVLCLTLLAIGNGLAWVINR